MRLRSRTTATFRKLRDAPPERTQSMAEETYQLFRADTGHPSLQFKKIQAKLPIYSARIDLNYRAVGVLDCDLVSWFWIGPHDEYERLIKSF